MLHIIKIIYLAIILSPLRLYAQNYELTYDVNRSIKIIKGEGRSEDEHLTSKIILTPNKISINEGDNERIFNFDEHTITEIDHELKIYIESSLYPELIFKGKELQHRADMAKMFDNTDVKGHYPASEFELESTFNILAYNSKHKNIKENITDNKHTFFYNGKDVVDLTLINQTVPKELHASLKHLYVYMFSVHPQIRNKMAGYNKFINNISLEVINTNKQIYVNYSLLNVKKTNIEPVTPLNYKRVFSHNENLNILYDKVLNAAARHDKSFYETEIKRLVSKKNYLDAFLAAHEYVLQYNARPDENIIKLLKPNDENDPASIMIKFVLSDDGKYKQDLEDLVTFIKKIDRSDLKYGYLLDVFLGKALFYLDIYPRTYEEYYIKVLTHNPILVGAYSELADMYQKDFDPFSAFKCIEIIKALDPKHEHINKLNMHIERVKKYHPEYV